MATSLEEAATMLHMKKDRLAEEWKPIPEPQTRDVRVFTEQKVMVTV